MFEKGERVAFHYPTLNTVSTDRIEYCWREIDVISIRDLVQSPITVDEFLRRPFVRRSRWLVLGRDIANGGLRKFYTGASPEFHAPSVLRVALYRPGENRPYHVLSRGFEANYADRRDLVKLLCKASQLDTKGCLLRVVADDLRLLRDTA